MNEYQIYIKSHCEAPDYEDTCEANNVKEASEIFAKKINRLSEDYWDAKDLIKHIDAGEGVCPVCKDVPLDEKETICPACLSSKLNDEADLKIDDWKNEKYGLGV